MYEYCVYTAVPKSQKIMSNCVKRAETNIVLIVFSGVLYHNHVYNPVTVLLHKSGTIKFSLGSCLINTEKLFNPFVVFQIAQLQNKQNK